jgi:hypothetical protein
MSQFPVETGDLQSLAEGVNYLLSGPGGLGQDFAGVTSSDPNWITGNFRIPYTQDTLSELYVPDIPLSNAEMLDLRTYKYTFATPQGSPPFSLGNGINVGGFSDPIYNSANNGTYPIGVVQCTTTYFIVRSLSNAASLHAPEASVTAKAFYYSTAIDVASDPYGDSLYSSVQDLRVTVTGATDRVFVSSQSDITLAYTATGSGTAYVVADIERWVGVPNSDPTNPDFFFEFESTVIYKIYEFAYTAGTNTIDTFTNVFTSVVDDPATGYYRYFYNLGLGSDAAAVADFQYTNILVNARSMSTQVVKA